MRHVVKRLFNESSQQSEKCEYLYRIFLKRTYNCYMRIDPYANPPV